MMGEEAPPPQPSKHGGRSEPYEESQAASTTTPPTYEPIDVFRVIETIANPDPEVRNHRVTDAYWEMSQMLDGLLHDGLSDRSTPNANWFTIATWAISTVGRNIRANELPRRLDQMLPSGLRAQATPWVLSMRSKSGRRVQRALGHGQIVVFASTMLPALKFVQEREQKSIVEIIEQVKGSTATFSDLDLTVLQLTRPVTVDRLRGLGSGPLTMDQVEPLVRPRNALTTRQQTILRQIAERSEGGFDWSRGKASATLTSFLEQLGRTGDDVDGLDLLEGLVDLLVGSDKNKQDLAAGFDAYVRASKSTDSKEVAEEIFRGNLLITAVEQYLLDRAVTTVIDHVPLEFEDWFELNASVWGERLLRVPRALGRLGVSRRFRRSQELVKDAWARLLTDQILVLALPTETLRIGRDIPLRSVHGKFFPSDLETLPTNGPRTPTSDADRLSTHELFTLFDRSRGDGIRTGAWDWRRFDERMNFAANLLRSRQQDPTLFWRPYNDEDRERIRNSRVPVRTGDAFEQTIAGPTFDWLESNR